MNDPPAPPEPRRTWIPVVAWSAVAASLIALQHVSRMTKLGTGWFSRWSVEWYFSGWSQFDGPEYLQIAERGYAYRQLVWFPVYPLAIRGVSVVTGNELASGVVLSLAGGLAAAVLFWRWTERREMSSSARVTALAVMLLYPYGWFLYGVVYSDAIFVALVLGAFVALDRDRRLLCGVLGALATATRPTGMALVLALFVTALERDGVLAVPERAPDWVKRLRMPIRVELSRLSARSFAPLLSFVGIAAYMTYLWIEWGSPVRFASVQELYHEGDWPSLVKQQYFDAWSQGFDGRHLATTTAQAVLLAAVLLAVPAVGRRFGWGYALFTFSLAAIPGFSVATFMGTGRYLIPIFPVYALVGEWLSERRVARVVWLTVSALALGVMTFGFARSWYLT